MPALPPDLQGLLDQVDAADRAADDLTNGVSDAQFTWQPDEGRAWSIAQCLEHLATANRIYGNAAHAAVERARARGSRAGGPIASTGFGRWFITSQDLPVRRRFRAPSKIRPGSGRSREEILRMYHEAHQRIRALVTDCAGIDVNRTTFKNPFLPLIRVRVGTALRVISAHDRRHLWQAEQVKKAPGFPSAR